ncbi:hypothetical protein [Profundibacter sp.]
MTTKRRNKMKKTLIASAVLVGLGAGFTMAPVSMGYAQETSTNAVTSQDWLDKISTRIDLAQAKVALLRAKIALEIEAAPERAQQALDDAKRSLSKAKETAKSSAMADLVAMEEDIANARKAIIELPDEVAGKIEALISSADMRLQEYKQDIAESEEVKLLKMRYAQAAAQSSLLQAQIAEAANEGADKVASYLQDAQDFYQTAKENAAQDLQAGLNTLSNDIETAKQLVSEKREQAGDAIIDLAQRAADFVRGSQQN